MSKMVKLSSLAADETGILKGRRFIVTARYPEDRASGITDVLFESGLRETFVWDRDNPMVRHLGTGSVEITIKWPAEQPA
jgi:hypothetical protein